MIQNNLTHIRTVLAFTNSKTIHINAIKGERGNLSMHKSYRENACVNGNNSGYGKQDYREMRSPSNNDKSPYHFYGMHKSEKTVQGQNKFKSNSGFIGVNNLASPTHSTFQRKIRQAIEIRYTKSNINTYKYLEIQHSKSQVKTVSVRQDSPQHSSKSSQLSEQMQEMKHFAYLKNVSYINIYQFHSQKSTINKKEQSKESDKYKKRRFKLPSSYGIVSTEQKQSLSSREVGKIKLSGEMQEKKDTNKMDEAIRNFYCQNGMQQIHEEKQKRFLTSRLPYQKEATIVQNQKQKKSMSSLSRQLATQNQKQINDIFKLKHSDQILNKNQQDSQNHKKIEEKTQRYSQNAKTKARRFLKNIKTEPNQQSQLNYQNKNSNLNSSFKKLVSLRKIQTQFIEPALNQQQIYNKTTKNKARMIKNYRKNNFLMNKTNQNSQRSFHVSSQQKWKLEEISFKFKPINQIQLEQTALEMEKQLTQNRNQALNLGLSLQKAYQKLMENKKKMQSKGQSSARIYQGNQEINKRRMLRVSPKNENPLRKSGQKESKFAKKDQSQSFCSPLLLENRSQMSLGRESMKNKLLKKNKGQRISTIE